MPNLIQIKQKLSFSGTETAAIDALKANSLKQGEPAVITYNDGDNDTVSLLGIGSNDTSQPFIYYDGTTINKIKELITKESQDRQDEDDKLNNKIDGIQIDNVGGTKNLTLTAPIVSVTATSQINYTGFISTTLKLIKVVNNSTLEVVFSFDNLTAANNKIIKEAVSDSIIIPSGGSIDFMKLDSGWKIINVYGLTYFPDLADDMRTDDYAMIVKKDGLGVIENVGYLKEIDESITSDLTAAELDARFPNIYSNFQLVCPTVGFIYEKISDLAGWIKYPTQRVV